MKKIKEEVASVVANELKYANENFPAFSGPHEGYAVMLEEYEELQDEYRSYNFHSAMGKLWENVKRNDPDYCEGYARVVRRCAINIACEAIQLAAMCEKFLEMPEKKKG